MALFFLEKNLTMFLKYEKLLSILEKILFVVRVDLHLREIYSVKLPTKTQFVPVLLKCVRKK